MQNSEDGCIRYLMKEMDPSEEVEFEREMLSDEDLLIEVECLRQTLHKLGKLPEIQPPTHLTDHIRQQALQTQQNRLNHNKRIISWFGKSVAAVAAGVLIVSMGTYMWPVSEGTAIEATTAVSGAGSTDDGTTPWVDRNDVIRYSDQFQQAGSLEFEAQRSNSMKKLVRVEVTEPWSTTRPQVQLTGTSN
ncbi:MAG: hypothetical protein AAFW89_14940 [Bacteroidota bacterium]